MGYAATFNPTVGRITFGTGSVFRTDTHPLSARKIRVKWMGDNGSSFWN